MSEQIMSEQTISEQSEQSDAAPLAGIEASPPPADSTGGMRRLVTALLHGEQPPATPPATPAKRGARGTQAAGARQQGFVDATAPALAALLVWSSTLAIHDPYRPCAPTTAEASAIVSVPTRWLARTLDRRHLLSAETLDVVLLALALTSYGERAYGTYRTIHEETHDGRDARDTGRGHTGGDGQAAPGAALATAGAATARYAGAGGESAGSDGGSRVGGPAADDHRGDHRAGGGGPGGSAGGRPAALGALIADATDGARERGVLG